MTVTMHMVSSLDGFVAKKNNDVSWMEASWCSYKDGQEMTADLVPVIDCYIMGSRTYELALHLGWPYGDTRTIVVTSRQLESARSSVEFYSGDLAALLDRLTHDCIWLVGGPNLCREFLRLHLVDEVCLTIAPVLLGGGLGLFSGDEQMLRLKKMNAFKNGMIDVWYDVVRSDANS